MAFVADNTREEGIIEIMQSSKFKNINNSIVKFEWTATNIPNVSKHNNVVDKVYVNGATYSASTQRPFFQDKDVYLYGDLTFDFAESVETFTKNSGKLVVVQNATLKSKNKE